MRQRRDNALGRLKSGVMNQTEAAYAQELELRRRAGDIRLYLFESVTMKLAPDTRYTPDFMVMNASGEIEFHEVKGFWRDDARVKVKVAYEKFPFRFFVVTRKSGKFSVVEFDPCEKSSGV